jgi:hypothetical protein
MCQGYTHAHILLPTLLCRTEIAMQELVALAAESRFEQDPPLSMARELGIARLSASNRERLAQAVEKATT